MLRLWKRKKRLKETLAWDGFQAADDGLARYQLESRFFTLLWKALVVYCIVGGGMGCLLSALTVQYHVVIVQIVILMASLFLAFLYCDPVWENVGYILLFLVMVFLAWRLRNYINSGFYGVMNDMAEAVSDYFESNAMRSYGERVENRTLAITISMSYIGVACCLVINISISRRMQYLFSILAAGAGLFLPLYLELEPGLFFEIQLIWGLLMASSVRRSGHYALQKDNQKYKRRKNRYTYIYSARTVLQWGACCLAAVGTVVVLLSAAMPQSTYHDRHPSGKLKKSTEETVENLSVLGVAGLFNFYDNVGGLTSGRLGGVSALRLDYETDLTLTFVPAAEERFYLRQFVGREYVPVANHWERDTELDSETAWAMEQAYESGNRYMGKGRVLVENVAGQSSPYLPYYSLEQDLSVWIGRSQEYTYYTDFGSENPVLASELAGRTEEDTLQMYLEVPEDDRDIVQQIIQEAGLDAQQEPLTNADRLAEYYQEEIPYSYQPGITPYGKDFVEYFLSENRKGYCAHFASAATLIFRELGIPARYVEGYAVDPDDLSEEGEVLTDEDTAEYYEGYMALEQSAVVRVDVTDASAHAWVEIWLEGKGWQVVDITPASSQDESGEGLWSTFMRLFRGNSGNSASQGGESADNATSAVSQAENVIRLIVIGIVCLLILAAAVLFLRMIISSLTDYISILGKNRNDQVIHEYQRYVRKMGHQTEGFREAQNYREQIRILAEKGKITLAEPETERMVSLLEQAGFSPAEITPEEKKWIRQKLYHKNRS